MYSIALDLVLMGTDSDRQALDADPDLYPPKWCWPDQIRIHNTEGDLEEIRTMDWDPDS